MTDGIATLSLEPDAPGLRRWSAAALEATVGLREYVLGPENGLVRQGIGLHEEPAGAAAAGLSLRIDCVPLTLWAATGLGKSQLLRALAATWIRQHAPDSVLLLTAADFARSYAAAVKVDDVPRFQQRYQRIDFLLIDDLDALIGKAGAQQQLATIIEHRQRHQRPAVFSARQPLRGLGLSSRLTSRLASGLVIPLQLPSAATRQVILERLCEERQIRLTTEATQLLSASGSVTVPQLMGLLTQLRQRSLIDELHRCGERLASGPAAGGAEAQTAEARAAGGPITEGATAEDHDHLPAPAIDAAQVQEVLGQPATGVVEAADIIRAAARYFGLPPRNLIGSSRRKMDVLARSCAMFLMREMTHASYHQIGQHFGGRDHSTVMHACRKVSGSQAAELTTRNALQEIQRRLSELRQTRAAEARGTARSRRSARTECSGG